MKLRFDRQSLRLRVRKSDLEHLSAQGAIRESVQFPGSVLAYILRMDPGADGVSAQFQNGEITVTVPAGMAMHWIDSEEVGIYAGVALEDGGSLAIIIEKDFPCKHGSADENADTFSELGGD